MTEENPKCPRCRSWRSVVWVVNPRGGFMMKCNNCKLKWTSRKPEVRDV
jgi:transcription elongation factor Elf1